MLPSSWCDCRTQGAGAPEVDYAFAPGVTPYDGMLRSMFGLRPNTQVASGSSLHTISDFLGYLHNTAGLAKPAGDLFLVSHGSDRAWMQIKLDGTQTSPTTYEAVERAVSGSTSDPFGTGVTPGSIAIPSDVNHDAQNNLGSMGVNIRGCRIGVSRPFVDKLKEAMGNQSPITAPLHFHKAYDLGAPGILEFLAYNFEVVNKAAYADKAAVAAAFDAGGFTFKDGTAVPTAKWADWVPRNVGMGHRDTQNLSVPLGTTFGNQSTIPQKVGFRHDTITHQELISVTTMPTDRAGQMTQLQASLDNDPLFASTHPFPMYVRYYQSSKADFIANLSWAFSAQNASTLSAVGTQHIYTVLVPVTDPATGNLIFNFSPVAGSGLAPVTNLLTSDSSLFYTTP